jgi:hypothetical protein
MPALARAAAAGNATVHSKVVRQSTASPHN